MIPVAARHKADSSFVSRMTTDADASAIVRSIVDLARAPGLRSVAEGVEDEQTQDLLASMGCDAAQGYLISRPLRDHAITPWLAARAAARTGAAVPLGSTTQGRPAASWRGTPAPPQVRPHAVRGPRPPRP